MTTILATCDKLYADKRVSIEGAGLEKKVFNDNASKIFITTDYDIFVTFGEGEKIKKHKIQAMAFSGDGRCSRIVQKMLTRGKRDFKHFIRNLISLNDDSDIELIGGCYIAEEGVFGSFQIEGKDSFCTVENSNKKFNTSGSGSSFDPGDSYASYDGDALSIFLSLCYLDNSSSVNYDKFETEEMKIETIIPKEKDVEKAFLKNFNPHFYTDPKKIFI